MDAARSRLTARPITGLVPNFTVAHPPRFRSHQQPGRPLCGRPRLGSIAKRSNGLLRPDGQRGFARAVLGC